MLRACRLLLVAGVAVAPANAHASGFCEHGCGNSIDLGLTFAPAAPGLELSPAAGSDQRAPGGAAAFLTLGMDFRTSNREGFYVPLVGAHVGIPIASARVRNWNDAAGDQYHLGPLFFAEALLPGLGVHILLSKDTRLSVGGRLVTAVVFGWGTAQPASAASRDISGQGWLGIGPAGELELCRRIWRDESLSGICILAQPAVYFGGERAASFAATAGLRLSLP
jgi:hypothetical protein